MYQESEQPDRNTLQDVLQSVTGEEHLLRVLRDGLRSQRVAVASGDTVALEIASQAVASAALTLDNARRRREDLMQLLSGGKAVRLDTLERFAGPINGMSEARARLRIEAEAVVTDLALTQDVLQGALRAGNAYLQSLFSSVAEVTPSYLGPMSAGQSQSEAGGFLINRRA